MNSASPCRGPADAWPARMRRPRPCGCARRFPALKKAAACRGVIMYEDEASFWLDGTLHQTWARVGVQPRVDTFGMRKTAHIFGALRPLQHHQRAGTARRRGSAGPLSETARTGDAAWRAAPPDPHRRSAHRSAPPPRATHHRVRAGPRRGNPTSSHAGISGYVPETGLHPGRVAVGSPHDVRGAGSA